MIKIAITSDLHFEFWKNVDLLLDKMDTKDANLLIIAGDLHPKIGVRQYLLEEISKRNNNIEILFTEGNHDYYHGIFPSKENTQIREINGIKFALTTLWTHLTLSNWMYKDRLNDFRLIKGALFDKWNENHRNSYNFLKEANADVVITHHAPSFKSIHERYKGLPENCFFATDYTLILPEDFTNTKYWIHGHVHNEFDYMINNIRVICNPYGYPKERSDPKIKFIEV